MSNRLQRSMALMDAKADVKMIKERANVNWYDTKILANAVYLILEELTATDTADTPQTDCIVVRSNLEQFRVNGKERTMENRAMDIVADYIWKHLDKSDEIKEFSVYTVWKCKALQNWKFLISSTLLDGMYYEVTFNGDKSEWYLDAYKKFENQVIQEPKADTPQTECRTCKWAEVSWTSHYCDDCKAHNKYEPNDTPQTDTHEKAVEALAYLIGQKKPSYSSGSNSYGEQVQTDKTDCGWGEPR